MTESDMNCFVIAEAGVIHNNAEEFSFKLVAVEEGEDNVKIKTFKL